MIITYCHYVEALDIEIDLDCEVYTVNTGIGSYEYGGASGYDEGEKYSDVETISYNKRNFSDEEILIIDKSIESDRKEIEDYVINIYEDGI